ncbi:MCE family protein [Solicola gregarius]|uniref:MCE family protein n=1 Tax=Solicola gregarius TaxID=2908642 RepID=A0AA46TER4_9ACTN|nr:MCE family protein [Solicola gregarius]UYM03726.1 MCE family protein [Solicola gregarius]
MKPFRERNLVVVGLVSIAVIAVMMLAAFRADSLPLIGGGNTYYAEFSEAGGLRAGDDVRVAGIKVGEVKDITLEGDTVRVAMLVEDGVDLGSESLAAIKVKTVLGAMMVSIESDGDDTMGAGDEIPVDRTTPPYDVVQAFSDLSTTTQEIDTKQLGKSFDTLADVMDDVPDDLRGTLDGVSRLSKNLAARDQQINTLLKNVDDLSGTLADRNEELITLFEDSSTLFRALSSRRQAIHDILVSTRKLADEMGTLVDDTRGDLKPALDHLRGVVQVLQNNHDQIDRALDALPKYYTTLAGQSGNGPWLDSWAEGLGIILQTGEGASW